MNVYMILSLQLLVKEEIVNLTIADKSMNLNELNRKYKNDRRRDFIFNQRNQFIRKIYSSLSNKNTCYYLKFRIPMCHRQFFRTKFSKSRVGRKFSY